MIGYRARPERGLYFIGPDEHYPHKHVHAWTQNQDIDAHAWFPCYTLPGDKATSEMLATVPAGMFALSNGRIKYGRHRIGMAMSDRRVPYRVETAGAAPNDAVGAVLMLHGRGASAPDILSLVSAFGRDDLAYLAPAAPSGQWYPYRFTEPLVRNEPGITLGLQAIDDIRAALLREGLGAERTVLLGFSQGACLALEYAARNAQRFGGVVGLSGGLIGPDGTPRDYPGSLESTPIFLGCSDVDFHIPLYRVQEASRVFEALGARVTTRIYPGMPHTINDDEIEHVRELLAELKPHQA